MLDQFYPILFATVAAILGACIGSFLNVCIYRMPRELSVNEPKRSFCPSCKYQIPWSSNLPLITWIFQRGKCRNCSAPISIRYFLVELLTGLLFLAVWYRLTLFSGEITPAWFLFLPYAIFVSMLVVATFVDFEFFEIPDQITIGGTVVGIVLSFLIPPMHEYVFGDWRSHLWSGAWSIGGAALGFVLLWLVSYLGKKAFGKKTRKFSEPVPFVWTRTGEDAALEVAGEKLEWIELFSNDKDVLVIDCATLEFQGGTKENHQLHTRYEQLELDGKEHKLGEIDTFRGTLRSLSWKRDAMGFGDVKFIACIGAFLGWKAVLLSIMAGSLFGTLVALLPALIGKREWSPKIPFGPYLSLGALLWIFCGEELVKWYLSFNMPAEYAIPPAE